MENNELYHYGVLGMHWGVRRTPEQLGHRTKSSGSARSAKARVMVNKKKAGSTKLMTAEEKEAKKKEAMDSHDPRQVYANKDLFSDAELRSAYTRLLMEKQIKDLTPKQKNKGAEYIDAAIKWGGKVTSLIGTGVGIYNAVEKVEKIMKQKKKG